MTGTWLWWEPRKTARNGEIVVAILEDEEATLKRFYKERGSGAFAAGQFRVATDPCRQGRDSRCCARSDTTLSLIGSERSIWPRQLAVRSGPQVCVLHVRRERAVPAL